MATFEGQTKLTPVQVAWLQELGLDKRLLQVAFRTAEPSAESGASLTRAPEQDLASRTPPAKPVVASHERRDAKVVALPEALPDDLGLLKVEVDGCTRCDLHAGRHQAVFGVGQAQAPDWMVIGEAPGDQDDQSGLPFQGPAGQLLHNIFAASQLSSNATFYYTNAVKCRPRGGRVPRKAEIEACLPFLHAQINQVQPKAILVLGWMAAQALLQEKGSIEQLRERVHSYTAAHGRIPVLVTYHPAALLLRGRHKAQVWRDMHTARMVMQEWQSEP